eukprot:Gb_02214 [translate_table: standard]
MSGKMGLCCPMERILFPSQEHLKEQHQIGVAAGEQRFESLLSLGYNDKSLILGGEQEPEQLAEINSSPGDFTTVNLAESRKYTRAYPDPERTPCPPNPKRLLTERNKQLKELSTSSERLL